MFINGLVCCILQGNFLQYVIFHIGDCFCDCRCPCHRVYLPAEFQYTVKKAVCPNADCYTITDIHMGDLVVESGRKFLKKDALKYCEPISIMDM